jgi:lipopolysaccharide transport system ATP-binding protein
MNSEPAHRQSPAGSKEPAVQVNDLCKEFAFYPSPWGRLVEWLSLGRMPRHETISALDRVSFQVERGGALALVGANGAGKSTLLKIISGTLFQTSGSLSVGGRVASLLELGMGFQPEFSGRDNIFFNGRFLGLTEDEIRERVADIIAFAELEDAIDRPLRTYSSGMMLRLAFAVVAHVDPDILVIDEALAVGDAYFTQKCLARIRRFRQDGVTLLFASHDPLAVKTLCDQALLLEHGRPLAMGAPSMILEKYNARLATGNKSGRILDLEASVPIDGSPSEQYTLRRSGNFKALVAEFSMATDDGRECRSLIAGARINIGIRALFLEEVEDPTVGILIRDRLGNDVYGTNTYQQGLATGTFQAGEVADVTFGMSLDLGPGEYSLTVALHTLETHVEDSFDWIDRLVVFKVLPPPSGSFTGTAFLRPRIGITRAPGAACSDKLEKALAGVFGPVAPRRLSMSAGEGRWRLRGWYPVESGEQGSFAWTRDAFAFVMDLRGTALELEVGRPPGGDTAGEVLARVWIGTREVDPVPVGAGAGWYKVHVPIPPQLAVAFGCVRIQVPTAQAPPVAGSQDLRRLGLRVRSIHVA